MAKGSKVWFACWTYNPTSTTPLFPTEHLLQPHWTSASFCAGCAVFVPVLLPQQLCSFPIFPVSSSLPSVYPLFTLQCLLFGEMFDALPHVILPLISCLLSPQMPSSFSASRSLIFLNYFKNQRLSLTALPPLPLCFGKLLFWLRQPVLLSAHFPLRSQPVPCTFGHNLG